jgi:hypothetical protein
VTVDAGIHPRGADLGSAVWLTVPPAGFVAYG